jgi:chromosome segregation ATPase
MGLFSFFSLGTTSPPSVGASDLTTDGISFSEVADHLEYLQEANEKLKSKLQESQQANASLRHHLTSLQRRVAHQDADLGALRSQCQTLKVEIATKDKGQQKNVVQLKTQLKAEQDHTRASQRILKAQLQARAQEIAAITPRLRAVASRYETIQVYADQLRRRGENDRLQLEYLRCTSTGPLESSSQQSNAEVAHSQSRPFVVMLVDGDAYGVCDHTHPFCRELEAHF